MANIQDQDVNLGQENDENLGAHPYLVPAQALRNPQERADAFSISLFLIRIFVWTCIFMVAATNCLTVMIYYDLIKYPVCSKTLAICNYVFTAAMTLFYVIGFHEYFLLACFLRKEIPKSDSLYLTKFSILAPVIVFLILSDYFETKYNCRPSKNPGFIFTQLFIASSMMLVVFTSLYTLSNFYKIWLITQKRNEDMPIRPNIFRAALKECVDSVNTPKAIETFKNFSTDFKDMRPKNLEIRNLIWIYSMVHLRRKLKRNDLKKHGHFACSICEQNFQVFHKVILAEYEKGLKLCHQGCLLTKLFSDERYFMPLERLSSMLSRVASKGESIVDLALQKTI